MSNTSVGEGGVLFYCMYLIKFARDPVFWKCLQVLLWISGTLCSQVLAIIMVIRVKST